MPAQPSLSGAPLVTLVVIIDVGWTRKSDETDPLRYPRVTFGAVRGAWRVTVEWQPRVGWRAVRLETRDAQDRPIVREDLHLGAELMERLGGRPADLRDHATLQAVVNDLYKLGPRTARAKWQGREFEWRMQEVG